MEPPMKSLLCLMGGSGEGCVGRDGFGCALSRNLHFISFIYLIRRHPTYLFNPDSLRGYPFDTSTHLLFSHSRTEVPWIDGKMKWSRNFNDSVREIRISNFGEKKKKLTFSKSSCHGLVVCVFPNSYVESRCLMRWCLDVGPWGGDQVVRV